MADVADVKVKEDVEAVEEMKFEAAEVKGEAVEEMKFEATEVKGEAAGEKIEDAEEMMEAAEEVKADEINAPSTESSEEKATAEEETENVAGKKATDSQKPRKLNNSKFDASLLPESDDPAEIRKQVEFYFSDSNLLYDKFLFTLVSKENRPVPLKLIASFKRMRRFTNFETVVSALKESDFLEVAGEPGSETIKRKDALDLSLKDNVEELQIKTNSKPKLVIDRALTRSVYAKGFGEETPTTQFDIEKFFEPFGPINAVRLRRKNDRSFKGSVFVEFANDELLQKFMALEDKPTWNDTELTWMSKEDYVKQKIEDIKSGKIKAQPDRERKFSALHDAARERKGNKDKNEGGRGGRGGARGRGGRGGRGGRASKGGSGGSGKGGKGTESGSGNGVIKDAKGIPQLKTSGKGEKSANGSGDGKRRAEKQEEQGEAIKVKIEEQEEQGEAIKVKIEEQGEAIKVKIEEQGEKSANGNGDGKRKAEEQGEQGEAKKAKIEETE